MRNPRVGLVWPARHALITAGALLFLATSSGAKVDDPPVSRVTPPGADSSELASPPVTVLLSAGESVVKFTLPVTQHVLASVHDLAGRRLRTLADARFAPGPQRLSWDGHDADGRAVAAGVYFVRLEIEGVVQSRRIVRLP